MNRNFANMPIYSPYDENDKPSRRVGPNTPEWLEQLTTDLDESTKISEDAYEGIVSISPALIEMLFKEYTRAPGRMAMDLGALATEDELDINRVPLARKFYSSTEGKSADSKVKGFLYEVAGDDRKVPLTDRMKSEIEAAWDYVNKEGLLNQRTLGRMWSDIKERHNMELPYYVGGKKLSQSELREKVNRWEEKRK